MSTADPNYITSLVSAIASVLSAGAAFWSAASARSAQKSSQRIEQDKAQIELTVRAKEVSIEAERVIARGAELKQALDDAFRLAGQHNSPRLKTLLHGVDEKIEKVKALKKELETSTLSENDLEKKKLEDIAQRQARVSETLVHIRAIREDMEREIASAIDSSKEIRKLQGFDSI